MIASALLISGLYLLYMQFAVSNIVMGKLVLAGAALAVIGGAWLWADFISPNSRSKEPE